VFEVVNEQGVERFVSHHTEVSIKDM